MDRKVPNQRIYLKSTEMYAHNCYWETSLCPGLPSIYQEFFFLYKNHTAYILVQTYEEVIGKGAGGTGRKIWLSPAVNLSVVY